MSFPSTRENWGGARHIRPDTTTLSGSNNLQGDQHVTSGNMPGHGMANDAFMNKYMKDERFFPYFGFANAVVPPNNYMAMDEENYVLPDAYKGSNNYMRTIIITSLLETELWGTSIALPWKKLEHTMEIAWDEWIFNDTLPTRTPEEAVSRLLSSHFMQHKSYIVRYGLAAIMEHGFYKTSEGSQHWALQLVQIKNAIAHGAQYGVTIALLNPPNYIDDNEKYSTRALGYNRTQINNWFQQELDEWACFQKSEDGWMSRLSKCDERMQMRNQQVADMWVVPAGSRKFVNNRPEHKWFFLSGGIQKKGFDKAQLQTGDGRMVVESVMHKMGEHEPSSDPTYREQTIGGLFHMVDEHLGQVPLEQLQTDMYDTWIYSEDRDDFYRIGYRHAVRCFGLYHGWDTAVQVGDMPLTEHLGLKAFEGINNWGEVYQQADRLERFIKQLQRKDDLTYREFIAKFIMKEPEEEKKSPEDEYRQANPGAIPDLSADMVMLKLNQVDFPETAQGHRARLQTLLKKLDNMDAASMKELGKKTLMRHQAGEYVLNHPVVRAIEQGTMPSNPLAAAMAYHAAQEYAQDAQIVHALDVATKKQYNKSPLELYVAADLHGCWGCATEKSSAHLNEENEKSPYWKPAPSAQVTEVALIAPEPAAAEHHGTVKTLQYSSQAYTLASAYTCLFYLDAAEVDTMIAHKVKDGNLGIIMHLGSGKVDTYRLGRLQFSVVLSAMYATLCSGADEKTLAKQWVELAQAKVIASQDKAKFKAVVEACDALPILPYQSAIDGVIKALKDGLISLYKLDMDGRTDKEKEEYAIKAVHHALLKYRHYEQGGHLFKSLPGDRTARQVETQSLFDQGLRSELLHSVLGVDNSDYDGTYNPRFNKQPSADEVRVDKAELTAIAKKLDAQLKDFKKKQPAGVTDTSKFWKPTYVLLKTQLEDEQFNVYLNGNEQLLHHVQDRKKLQLYTAANNTAAGNGEYQELFLNLAGVAVSVASKTSMGTQLAAAIGKWNGKDITLSPAALAVEWTRLWSSKTTAMTQAMTKIPMGTDAEIQTFAKNLVSLSLAMNELNLSNLRAEVGNVWTDIAAKKEAPNQLYPFIFTEDAKKAINDKVDVEIMDPTQGPAKRLSPDVIRNFMLTGLPVRDGYFWKWCIEHDMVQAIGVLGFRPNKRYEMGTMIGLSAWGQTGYTFHGHADMMLSDNAATKMHYAHFTYYSKSQVMHSRKIIHARNVVCRDYLGGNGHRMWDATDPDDRTEYHAGEMTKDIFVVPVMMNHKIDTNHMDITGSYHPDIGAGEDAQQLTRYPSAQIYKQYWGWRNNTYSLSDKAYRMVPSARDNTIVFQEHQNLYNHGSKTFDLVIRDKGHFGDRIYPGCGKVRRGIEMYLKPVKYDNTNTIGFTV